MKPNPPALILIDIQVALSDPGYYGGERNNPNAEANAGHLLAHWRHKGWPLIHVKHDSIVPGSPLTKGLPGNDIRDEVKPLSGETVIGKHQNSAFIGTDLENQLKSKNIDTVVIAGLTTQHCVSTTVRMAANLGFKTFLANDATAAFSATGPDGTVYPADLVHRVAIAELNQEFATVLSTDQLLKQF